MSDICKVRGFELLDLLFFFFFETLFLVDNQKAKVLENNLFRKEFMGADNEVNFSIFHGRNDFFLGCSRH